jgi:LytS/YehU family sensor histidine kinase
MYTGMALLLLAFEVDALATAAGAWQGGYISKYVFFALFLAAMVVVFKIIPNGINALSKAKELELQRSRLEAEKNMAEAQLKESRISIMLSQIKPHFLYNVLNSIYHLYRKEPETAQQAVSSFAEYLRCNMLSIEKQGLIPFDEEYQHIQTYLSLEQIRFRGKLEVVYDVEVTDFALPPLTVEPLVENAVKHGVTKKRGGGVITISTRKTNDEYVVTVSDTGVGFDPAHYMEDGKPHIGIHNVKERLRRIAGGDLSITSTPEGTLAVVTIPRKEATDENYCG